MIIESRIVTHGCTVSVTFSRCARGYSAELCFGAEDRAVLDARSLPELEAIVEVAAGVAVLARKAGGPSGLPPIHA